MSIVIFDEVWSGRTFAGSVLTNSRQYKKAFFAMSDDPDDTEATLRAHSSFPKKLDTFGPSDPFTVVTDVSVNRTGPLTWGVEATYVGNSFDNESAADAKKLNPTRRWGVIRQKVPITKDLRGSAIENVNGEPFDPPIEVDKTDVELTWVGHFDAFDPATMFEYNDSINLNPLVSLGVPARCAKLSIESAEEVEVDGNTLWRVTIKLQFRNDVDPSTVTASYSGTITGWDLLLLNQGYKVRPTAGAQPTVADANDNYRPRQNPVPLKSDGTKATAQADYSYLNFDIYPQKSWTALGIT